MAKPSLRGKLLGHFQSVMATIADPAAFEGRKSGQLTGQTAARFADQVLAIVRAHDEEHEPHPKCTDHGCSYCNPGEGVVDAHICCEHIAEDPEVSAMAALLPALPLVSRLGHDARERVMDWARHRACDSLPPF